MVLSCLGISAAFLLDLIFGDPAWLPHPVRGIGYCAQRLEPALRTFIKNERVSGIIFAVLIIGGVYGAAWAGINAVTHLNRYLGAGLSMFFIYTSLAVKDLRVESMRVYCALKKGDLDSARRNVGMIVGRDTHSLNDKEIIRATVETVAENAVDGIISPLFFAFLGGAPLALAYKAASTLDSMVGYKNKKYRYFGWASARIDDCLNFIPARLAVLIMPLACACAGLHTAGAFKIALRDRAKNPSPNSGIPEAAMAGALGVQLGGLNFYHSVPSMKPVIGDDREPLGLEHIRESIRVTYISALLCVIVGSTLTILINYASF